MTRSISHSTSRLEKGPDSEQEDPRPGGHTPPRGAHPLPQQVANSRSRQLRRDSYHEQTCPNRAPTDQPCGLELALRERIGKMVEQFQVERQSKVDRSTLAEANAALKRVLGQIENEKAEIHESVRANVEKILMPTLRALASEIPPQQKGYVTLLQRQLNELTSPFATKISKAFSSLTPAEIEICDMIRNGMSTKEIASLRHVAPATVSKQRERIRRKLDLSGTDANLTTHLLMLASEDGAMPSSSLSESAILY